MKHAEHIAKSVATPKTGFFATLRAVLHGQGCSAPSPSPDVRAAYDLRTPLAIASLCVWLLTLALAVAPALAARGHVFEGKHFGEPCLLEPCEGGKLKEPSGVAVNEATGDVYVVDKGDNRVEVFSATGAFEGQFDGSGTFEVVKETSKVKVGIPAPAGKFESPEGIAVDNSCHVQKLSGVACAAADPSNEDVYVADAGHKVIDKFTPTGEYIGQITAETVKPPEGFFLELDGVAVDTHGDLWMAEQHRPEGGGIRQGYVDNLSNAIANKVEGSRQLSVAGFMGPGLAVDSEANIYVHAAPFGEFVKFTSKGELLKKALDEEPASAVAVELSTDDVYVDNIASVARFSPVGSLLERLGVPGEHGSGVAVDSFSTTLYVADSAADVVDVYPPEPPGVPTVQSGSESVSDVTAGSATFEAEVNPRSEPGEAPTAYRFEYGACATPSTCATSPYEQSVPVPDGLLAANYEPDIVTAHPQGLQPHTVYHFRVVAHNAHLGAAEGEERIFTTQTPGASALPDGRQWELVSPPNKHGASLLPIEGASSIQASAAGDAFAYMASASTEAEPPGNAVSHVQVLSRRGGTGASSWESQDIATPHTAAVGTPAGAGVGEYRLFSSDLSLGVVQPLGAFEPSLSPEASERTAYLRTDFPSGEPGEPCKSSCYHPLVTGAPGFANVPEGTAFGEEGECQNGCGPYFLGATPDLSHIVLGATKGNGSSEAALIEAAPPKSLYEWAGGQLQLISVLPGGHPAPPSAKPSLGHATASARIARNAISADGSRVVWSETEGNQHLYLRDVAAEETIQLDAVQSGEGKGTAAPVFQTASTSDSTVFFTDTQRLTEHSGTSDLYQCEITAAEEGLGCKLTDLTPLGAGEANADVQGLVLGASDDGSSIYFIANGVLTGEAVNAQGEKATAGQPNLYLRHAGATKLIAVLSGADGPDWSSFLSGGLPRLTARVSPDGRWLAFMSQRSLTRYDNRDASSGRPDEEVYLYDADGNGGEGSLTCPSCDPTGARPHGVEYANINTDNGGLAGGSSVWPDATWLAANIPGWVQISEDGLALYQSRYLSDSGRLFFNSSDALVAQDTNNTEDVYEYEPPGVGDCSTESSTFARASGGCVDLISPGTSKEESAFLDASEGGGDVFFLTAAQLSRRDLDTALDVYDARIGGGEPESSRPPACEGDACQSPRGAPTDPTPGSLTYRGPGNPVPPASVLVKPKTAAQIKAEKLAKALKACKKDKSRRKRVACEKQARRKYGATKARKATNKRRAKR